MRKRFAGIGAIGHVERVQGLFGTARRVHSEDRSRQNPDIATSFRRAVRVESGVDTAAGSPSFFEDVHKPLRAPSAAASSKTVAGCVVVP